MNKKGIVIGIIVCIVGIIMIAIGYSLMQQI